MPRLVFELTKTYVIPIGKYASRRFTVAKADPCLRGDQVDIEEWIGRTQWWVPKGELPSTDVRADPWDPEGAQL